MSDPDNQANIKALLIAFITLVSIWGVVYFSEYSSYGVVTIFSVSRWFDLTSLVCVSVLLSLATFIHFSRGQSKIVAKRVAKILLIVGLVVWVIFAVWFVGGMLIWQYF